MNAENIVNWPGRMAQGIERGTVRTEEEEGYKVHGPSGIFIATAAFSCLVRPVEGDKVIYVRDSEGGCYILAILERPTGPNAVMAFPGNAALESANGNITITAASGLELSTGSTIYLTASDLNLSAANGRLNILEMQATGESLSGNINRTRLVSETVDVIAKRLTQRLKSCFRNVDEVEQVSAGQMIQKVRNLFSVRARHSTITAVDDVKIEGQRVHLG